MLERVLAIEDVLEVDLHDPVRAKPVCVCLCEFLCNYNKSQEALTGRVAVVNGQSGGRHEYV